MRNKALPGWAYTLCTAAAALVFLLAYELVVYRVPVTEIFLPVSSWSDEVIYSKQLAAAVQYGAPQGYFGFNESHAAVGTYAAWGPAVFLVYALPGLLLRGQNAFLWCNLLFVVLGWTFFARAARLGWKRQLAFAVALAAMNAPIRYVFSAMQEPLHYALMLAVLGCGILARRDKSRAAWAGLCVLCAVATLVRPYEAVLWLFPLALCRQDRRRIAVCVAGGTVSLGGTLVLMSKFYAPYFFTNVDVSPLQELARGQVVSAVRDVAHKLLDALRTVAEMLADQLANRSGGQYLLFFLLLGVTLVCLIVDARAGRPVFWKGCAAVTAVIVFLALLLMYRPVGFPPYACTGCAAAGGAPCGGRPPRRGHGSRRAGAGRARRAESGVRLHHAALQRRMGRRGAANRGRADRELVRCDERRPLGQHRGLRLWRSRTLWSALRRAGRHGHPV